MHPRKTLDCSWGLFPKALGSVLALEGRARAQVESAWPSSLATLSARSAFDLWLSVQDWPEGSEVLMSAITIPHMADIVRAHGFVPIAVDLCLERCTPSVGDCDARSSERSVALVVAHLFGARHPVDELAAWAQGRGIALVEDCAQCYAGTPEPLRDGVSLALYSFGSIKTATCLGGGVAQVRRSDQREAMRLAQEGYRAQSRLSYVGKVLKYMALYASSQPRAYPIFVRLLDAIAGDYDAGIRYLVKGFADEDWLARLRRRPSAALLRVMAMRFERDESERCRRRNRDLVESLEDSVLHLGHRAPRHTHWLVPVAIADREECIRLGREHGFDLTHGSSTLVALSGEVPRAREAMENIVYLSVADTMSPDEQRRLGRLVSELVARQQTGTGLAFAQS